MFEFHTDKQRYFNMQYNVSKHFVIPFLSEHVQLSQPKEILEIGCAEAGVLKAFTEQGHKCTGIELHASRVELAKAFMKEEVQQGNVQFFSTDIYNINPIKEGFTFDVIILKDVIEHIHDQDKFLKHLQQFLKPDGVVFFGFPPWQMPFGGHQQICQGKFAAKLPYYHLLPKNTYKFLLNRFGENQKTINDLLEIKQTRISTERFEKLIRQNGYTVQKQQHFLINPIYKYKFNLKPRKQLKLITALPHLRNFLTTCAYYLVSKKEL